MDLVAPVDNGVPVESYLCYFTNSCMGTNANEESPSQFSVFNHTNLTAGTSFASPQVSAVAALLWTANPALTASQVRYTLDRSALPISSRFNTLVGYGSLDAYNVVRAIDTNGAPINSKNVVIQSTRNSTGNIATRYSFNGGDSWSMWDSGVSTSDEVALTYDVNGNHIVQAMRAGTNLYARTGSIQNDALVWNPWSRLGSTSGAPKLLNANGVIILSMKGSDGTAYIRTSNDWGTGWNHWYANSKTTNAINMVYYAGINRVVQSMRGTDGKVYNRYSNNQGTTWTNWAYAGIKSTGEVTLNMAATYIDQTVRGTDGFVYMRYSKDGAITWSAWFRNGFTTGDISSMYTGNDRVVQFMRNGTKSYTRYSLTKGRQWTSWTSYGYTETNPVIFFDTPNSRLFLAVRISGGGIYTRNSTNGGVNWSAWEKNGTTTTDINFGNAIYESW